MSSDTARMISLFNFLSEFRSCMFLPLFSSSVLLSPESASDNHRNQTSLSPSDFPVYFFLAPAVLLKLSQAFSLR